MATESWVIPLTAVAANGDVTQLYPAKCTAGTALATATNAQMVRTPTHGELISIQVQTDGTNAGVIEIYDINGIELGINVSSLTAITDTQLDAAIASGDAVLLYSQNVVATGVTPPSSTYRKFMKGLAARFVSGGGTCTLNLVCSGGYAKRHGTV
jgi:hypothetical protein